jgi:hypothetical protein
MQEQQNIDPIKALYQAFGKETSTHVASHLVWPFDAPPIVPYAGDYKTPDEVRRRFFGSLAETQTDRVRVHVESQGQVLAQVANP